jgi:hypothetical protein
MESSYFRLDIAPLKPKSRHRAHQGAESLLEIRPGEYVEIDHVENGNLGFYLSPPSAKPWAGCAVSPACVGTAKGGS